MAEADPLPRSRSSPPRSGFVLHTKHEARKALTIDWNQVERDCEAFDQAEARLRKDQRHGINALLATMRARGAWKKLVQSFHRYEAVEAAWKQAEVALGVFRPDGRLNDRAWAQAQVAPALPQLVAGSPRMIAHPGLPQIQTCGSPASGSSSHEFATSTIRRLNVDT